MGVGVLMGIGVIEAVDIGQQHQGIGPHQLGHQGGEGIVVAELDFLGGDGVVFIDDGHGAVFQQAAEGIDHVGFAAVVLHHVPGEQHLGGDVAILGKLLVVCIHQLALADGGGGLLAADVPGAFLQPQVAGPHADGAGGDQHDFPAGVF